MTEATYLTIRQLCALWDVTPQTLRNYKAKNFGPQPIQLLPGRRGVRYLRADVEAFDAERRRAAGHPPKEA